MLHCIDVFLAVIIEIMNCTEKCFVRKTVFHFHLHMIPRYKGDEVGLGWKMGELTDEDKEDILSKVK